MQDIDISRTAADYAAPPDLLAGRNILVSGAGAGIGRAAALAFAAHGAEVILLGRTVGHLEQTSDLIGAAGGKCTICPLDLERADADAWLQFQSAVHQRYPVLHGLLNNAGLLGPRTPLQGYPVNDWMRVMQVNLHGTFILTQHLLPMLLAADTASIVFTGSGVGRRGRAYWGAYAASKFATEGLAQVLADELDTTSGVRVNVINPGAVRTAMRAAAYPGEDPETLPQPADIMASYLYLMGTDSTVTGASLDAQPRH